MCYQTGYCCVGDAVCAGAGAQELCRGQLQDAQDVAELQQGPGKIGGACGGLVSEPVNLTGELVQYRDCRAAVEIIVHGLLETRLVVTVRLPGAGVDVTQGRVQPGEAGAGFVQVAVRVIQRAAIMAGEYEKAYHFGQVTRHHFPNGEKITQRLGHFLIIDAHEAVVYPQVGEGAATGAATLGNLIFMVREAQVLATAVDIEIRAQAMRGHGRAFDMPAGSTPTPGRIPGRLVGLCRFPQHEVHRVGLGFLHIHPDADPQLVNMLAGQLAVVRELTDVVEHITVLSPVSIAVLEQAGDHGDNLLDVVGGSGFMVRRQHVQCAKIFVHGLDKARRQLLERLAVVPGAVDDLVVNVGYIAYIVHPVTAVAQVAHDHVEYQDHARMTDMTIIVNRDATHVHTHLARFDGLEFFLLSRERVVYSQHGVMRQQHKTGMVSKERP